MDASGPMKPYRLGALLRRHDWELRVLGGELARMSVVVEELRRRHQEVLPLIEQACQGLREMNQNGQTLDLGLRDRLNRFLQDRLALAGAREQELNHAEAQRQELVDRALVQRVAVRSLERHRDRRLEDQRQEAIARGLRQADDLWLMRRNDGEKP